MKKIKIFALVEGKIIDKLSDRLVEPLFVFIKTELINHFTKADVFAYTYNPNIPYWNNTRSLKFFEYIGSEIPFIAMKCEGLKMISDSKGLLYVDYSADDFCEKLEYLLKNLDERVRLSRELRELKKDNTRQAGP